MSSAAGDEGQGGRFGAKEVRDYIYYIYIQIYFFCDKVVYVPLSPSQKNEKKKNLFFTDVCKFLTMIVSLSMFWSCVNS